MPPSPVTVDKFPGLKLDVEPTELGFKGALDLKNVNYIQEDLPEPRPGARVFTAVASRQGGRYGMLHPSWDTIYSAPAVVAAVDDGTDLWLETFGSNGTPIGSSLAIAATSSSDAAPYKNEVRFTSFGDTASTFGYVFAAIGAAPGGVQFWRYNVTTRAWDAPAFTGTAPVGRCTGVTPWDNRLISAGGVANGANASLIRFSDEGVPTTFTAANHLYLTPGDNEGIWEVVVWNNQVFVFKESKFFVFYGVSVDSTGGPVFEYRTLPGVGVTGGNNSSDFHGPQAVVGPDGVYFANSQGVWRTTGGAATLVSGDVGPLFSLASTIDSNPYTTIAQYGEVAGLVMFGERLMVNLGGAETLVYHTREGWWSNWELHGIDGTGPFCAVQDTSQGSPRLYYSGQTVDDIYQMLPSNVTPAVDVNSRGYEVQSIIATGGTAGDFTITWNGQTTAAIAYNASAATVSTALVNLSNIGVGEVFVWDVGNPLPNSKIYVMFFTGNQDADVAAMTIGTENVTNGNATIATERAGVSTLSVVDCNWVSGLDDLGLEGRKIVKEVVMTAHGGAHATGGNQKVSLAVDGAAHPTAAAKVFSGQDTFRFRHAATNVRGRRFSLKLANDSTGVGNNVNDGVWYPQKVTLGLMAPSSSGAHAAEAS